MRRLLLAFMLLGLSSANADEIPWSKINQAHARMKEAIDSKEEFGFLNQLRVIVEEISTGNNKFVAWDSTNWQIKYGVASYIHGDVDVLRINPYWGSIATSAHLLHSKDLKLDGVGYSSTPLHHKPGTAGFSIMRNSIDSKPGFTKLYVYGEAKPLSTGETETPEKCDKLARAWDDVYGKMSKIEEGLFILPADMYCPSHLFSKISKYYTVETTPIRYEDGILVDYVHRSKKIKRDDEVDFRFCPEV